MEQPPQPAPDVPAPPPGPEAVRSRQVLNAILLLGVLSVVIILFLFPYTLRSHKASNRTEALSNARQIGLALHDFHGTYGRFPDASTIPAVQADTGTTIPLGTSSSNDLFRQLIATGTRSEKIFWAKSSITPRKPDDHYTGTKALEKGECSFAYIARLTLSDDLTTPVLMAPVDPVTRTFERRRDYLDQAVILLLDGSLEIRPIDRHGRVTLNRLDLFDPRQPFWKGVAPDVKWPK